MISSQPRYDHFDTSPYMFTLKNEGNNRYSIFLENPLDKPVRKIINHAKIQQNQGFSAVFGGTTTQMHT